MKIEKTPSFYYCPCCGNIFVKPTEAQQCLDRHIKLFKKNKGNYAIKSEVLVYKFNDNRYGQEVGIIIDTNKNELWEEKVLVETESRERFWVSVANYQTLDLQSDPGAFNFLKNT